MRLDKSMLLKFLQVLDAEVSREITVVAVGGTAMTLLGLKPSTIDIDFTVPDEDFEEFRKANTRLQHGFKIDLYRGGVVFTQILPEDYVEKSVKIGNRLKHIRLKALHPVDIVVTKIGRLDERDLEDIRMCIRECGISKSQLEERARQVRYAGRDENYEINLQHVLRKFF
jgi:hypothetical protein